jgi:restriction endonuclease S subunit
VTKIEYLELNSLGKLRTGYSATKKIEVLPENATHWTIPIRAISKDLQQIEWSNLEPIQFQGDASRYLVKNGDVLISIRSIFVAIYIDKIPDNVLVNHNWVIFSPFKRLNPKYFVWWFNHPTTKQYLARFISGSALVSFFSLSKLKELKVPIPTLKQQSAIATLHQLRQRERELIQKLEKKREMLFNALTLKLSQGDL